MSVYKVHDVYVVVRDYNLWLNNYAYTGGGCSEMLYGWASNQKYSATTGLEDRTQRPLGCEYQRLLENGAWSP